MDSTPLLSPLEVADLLGLSAKSVRRLALAGSLPCVRLSERIIRFDLADVEAFIAARRSERAS